MTTATERALAQFFIYALDSSRLIGQISFADLEDKASELGLLREAPEPGDPLHSVVLVETRLGKRARALGEPKSEVSRPA